MTINKEEPFGTQVRFKLITATAQDRESLKGLGTYGFIKGAMGFIVGAAGQGEKNFEDYGYLMERLILFALDMGLGSCWLGASFTKSQFAKKISATANEVVPAIAAIGYIDESVRPGGIWRQIAGGHKRKSWNEMFFEKRFRVPLSADEAGQYAV